jgi:beta-adrenergic-receptor kinase
MSSLLLQFLKFVSEQGLVNTARFLFDVAAFRVRLSPIVLCCPHCTLLQSKISSNLGSVAVKIAQDYLRPGSTGSSTLNDTRRPDIVRVILPHKKKSQPPGPYPGKAAVAEGSGHNSGGSHQHGSSNSGASDVQSFVPPTTQPVNGANGTNGSNGSGAVANGAVATAHNGAVSVPMSTSLGQVVPVEETSAPVSPKSIIGQNVQMSQQLTAPRPKWQDFVLESDAATSDLAAVNALRCVGEPVERILDIVRAPPNITNYLFDELDVILFSYISDKFFEAFKGHEYYQKYLHFMAMTEQPVCEDDFALFRVLGRGGFGMVSGCKRCYSGRLFAMKVMNKKRVKLKKAEALCLNERNILSSVDSPYVVCLKYAFTTPTDLYLVLDLMIGGDLGYHLQRKHSFTMAETKFYAARILLGIGALHDLSIVYRDLKPENVLMDEHGYTKISDLGLACRVTRNGLSGTCGTRGYWAPEMLRRDAQGKRERYSLSVDWFSYGCCVYEFLIGVSPFRTEQAKNFGKFPKLEKADKDKAIDLAIQEMEPDLESGGLDETTKDFLRKLLHKDGKTRLGSKGYRDIMLHPWFADVDFDSLNQVQPPMTPPRDINMATQSEIGSFADDKQSRKIVLTEADHRHYESWLFISTRAFQEEVVEFLLMEELLVREDFKY